MDGINNCYRRACRITILTKSIIISNSDVKVLIEHAKSEDPKESCALLIGSETNEEWNVKEVFLTENVGILWISDLTSLGSLLYVVTT